MSHLVVIQSTILRHLSGGVTLCVDGIASDCTHREKAEEPAPYSAAAAGQSLGPRDHHLLRLSLMSVCVSRTTPFRGGEQDFDGPRHPFLPQSTSRTGRSSSGALRRTVSQQQQHVHIIRTERVVFVAGACSGLILSRATQQVRTERSTAGDLVGPHLPA